MMYDYDAENEDELTVKMGDILEILRVEPEGQEGWVEVRWSQADRRDGWR